MGDEEDEEDEEEVELRHHGIVTETGKGVLLFMEPPPLGRRVWWPKERVDFDSDTLTAPRWLVDKKVEDDELPESLEY